MLSISHELCSSISLGVFKLMLSSKTLGLPMVFMEGSELWMDRVTMSEEEITRHHNGLSKLCSSRVVTIKQIERCGRLGPVLIVVSIFFSIIPIQPQCTIVVSIFFSITPI